MDSKNKSDSENEANAEDIRLFKSDVLKKMDEIGSSIIVKSETELKLSAILTEYNALKSEIQTRSNYHQRLLELQLTALTVIAGAALAYQFAGKWIILLIPIESAIFGLWWIEHSLVISEIGAYIHRCIEHRLGQLLNERDILCWEVAMTYGVYRDPDRRFINFRVLLFLTFVAPSIGILLITLALLMRGVPRIETWVQLGAWFGIDEVYAGTMWYLAGVIWLIGFGLFLAYIIQAVHRNKLTKLRKQQTVKTDKLSSPSSRSKEERERRGSVEAGG